MHCMNYAKREQEKPLFFKPTLRSRFTPSRAQSLCLACQHFGLTTNCAKKNQPIENADRHMSLSLAIRTRYCALIRHSQKLYTEGLEHQRRRQSHKSFMSFRKRREILFRLETQTLITKKVLLEIVAQLCLENSIQTLLNLFLFDAKTNQKGFYGVF